ncbi:MAG TPA: glycosyltransferase [Candidatus Angelobacter sp.]|nr:glycosyltransferase [Candidatus Angelobacter sp.]
MQQSLQVLTGKDQASASVAATTQDMIPAASNGKIPHVLFLIDHLLARGGGEGNLLKVVELMPPELVRCSVATFRIKPEIRDSIAVPVYVFPWKRVHQKDAFKAALDLRRLIRHERVDIVQTYFETANLWGGIVAKLSGARLLSSRRDLGILRKPKHQLAYKLVNRISDRVLAVSEEVKRFCIDTEHIRPEKISVVHNGVDLRHLNLTAAVSVNPYAAAEWANAPQIITCVANVRRVKGIDVLVRTAQRVCRELPDAVFLIVGSLFDREYSQEVQALICSLGLEKNVKLLGFVEDPLPLLKMSNAFCLLSRSEGFCNALLEAMACGVPSVVTRVGGNPEAIADGENGFLTPVEDDKVPAERLLFLLRNKDQASRIGQAGKNTAYTRFSADTMIKNLVEVYRELLAEK